MVGVAPRLVAEDDVRTRPPQAPVVLPLHGERHRRHRPTAAGVEPFGESLSNQARHRRGRHDLRRHPEEALGGGEELVEVGQEVDALALSGARARAGPVRTHASDIGRERQRRKPDLVAELIALVQKVGSRPYNARGIRCVAVEGVGALLRRRRMRSFRETLCRRAGVIVDEVLHVRAGRIGDHRAGVELQDPQVGALLAQDPGVRGARGSGPHDDHVGRVCAVVNRCRLNDGQDRCPSRRAVPRSRPGSSHPPASAASASCRG